MIGQIISHYRIIEKLGDGGMGVVYKAQDIKLDRFVAIKFLNRKVGSDAGEKDRFLVEAKALAKLNHPNVATIYDIQDYDDKSFIVMEFIEGTNLRAVIDQSKEGGGANNLTPDSIIDYTIQILHGLQAAHQKNIVHRDIKPENIIIDDENHVKILDFGLAKITNQPLLTKTGTTIGTVAYMSPEQTRGDTVDNRTDIWSAGVIFFELLTGYRPFKGEYEQAVIYSILNEDPIPLKNYNPDLPEKLGSIAMKALAKNPAGRYQNCSQFLKDLTVFAKTSGVSAADISSAAEGSNDTAENRKKSAGRKNKIRWAAAGSAFILIAAASVIILNLISPSEVAVNKKIAVLPFVNMSNDPEDEYLSDGIMEDILTQLVKISDLKVISRTTMMGYKNSPKDIREISKDLNADIILEGSVRRLDDQLRISVQLIDSRTDEHLWAETYNEKLTKGFNLESKIALKIASALQIKLTKEEQDDFEHSKIYDPEIYKMILQGRYFVNKLDSASIVKGIELYSQALSMEPNDAMILTSLANAFTVYADCGFISTQTGYSKARELVEKALQLNDKLPVAHSVLGLIKMVYDWDWTGAQDEFEKAIKMQPGNTTTLNQMGQLAQALGKPDEAVLLIQQAVDLEPVTMINYVYLGQFLMYDNRPDEAVAVLKRGLEINPHFAYLHYLLGCAYLLQEKYPEALQEIEKEPVDNYRLYGLSMAYYALGRKKEADRTLNECIIKYRDIGAFYIAEIHAFRGETDKAFEWLEKAYSLRDGALSYITGDPFLKKIFGDPRFETFMKKMNLPV